MLCAFSTNNDDDNHNKNFMINDISNSYVVY